MNHKLTALFAGYLLPAAVLLAACGGGSGGGLTEETSELAPISSLLPEPSLGADPAEWSSSDEYSDYVLLPVPGAAHIVLGTQSGLGDIRAARAYASRTTGLPAGQGVTVAVLDDGIELDHPEFLGGRVSEHTFYYERENLDGSTERTKYAKHPDHFHGTHVAGTIGANRDGRGMHGVAYNATIKSIPVFVGGTFEYDSDYGRIFFPTGDVTSAHVLAAAIMSAAGVNGQEYSFSDGLIDHTFASDSRGSADIMNMSLGFTDFVPFGESKGIIQEAMEVAASRGKIMVASLGNDGGRGPARPPAAYVTEPGIAGLAIAVGAQGWGYPRAPFSNTCGPVKQYCLFAPGTSVHSTLREDDYGPMSGTSMAAPLVAGSLAVLKAAFPNDSNRNIVDRLLKTASHSTDDFGFRFPNSCNGVKDVAGGRNLDCADDVLGRGLLDLGAAMSWVGEPSIQTHGNGLQLASESMMYLPPGFSAPSGNGVSSLTESIVYDQLMFPFRYDLTRNIRKVSTTDRTFERFFAALGSNVVEPKSMPVGLYGQVRWFEKKDDFVPNFEKVQALQNESSSQNFRAYFKPTSDLIVSFGRNAGMVGMSHEFVNSRVTRMPFANNLTVAPYSALARGGEELGLAWQLDEKTAIDVLGETGKNFYDSGASKLGSIGLTRRDIWEKWTFGARFGALHEKNSMLGVSSRGAWSEMTNAATEFLEFNTSVQISYNAILFGNVSGGVTQRGRPSQTGGLVQGWSKTRTESFAIGGEFNGLWGADRVTFTASSPLRARNTNLRITIPVEEIGDDEVRFVEETIDLSPEGREVILQMLGEKWAKSDMFFAYGGYMRLDPGHDASAGTEYGIGAKMKLWF